MKYAVKYPYTNRYTGIFLCFCRGVSKKPGYRTRPDTVFRVSPWDGGIGPRKRAEEERLLRQKGEWKLKLTSSFREGRLTLRLKGELDHHSAKTLMAEIGEKIDVLLPRDCVIDMSALTFMDSSGIAVVLKTYKRMNEIGGRAWVENVPPQPMKVLDASGVERIIRITAGT